MFTFCIICVKITLKYCAIYKVLDIVFCDTVDVGSCVKYINGIIKYKWRMKYEEQENHGMKSRE
jgi:hypothetical protein